MRLAPLMGAIMLDDLERFVAQLDKDRPDWAVEFGDVETVRAIARAAAQGRPELAKRHLENLRYHTGHRLFCVVSVALSAGVVKLP